jgi:hypothetical protein
MRTGKCGASPYMAGSVAWPQVTVPYNIFQKNFPLSDPRIDKLESICRKLEQEVSNHLDYIADQSRKREALRSEFRTFYVERFKPLEDKVSFETIKDSISQLTASLTERIRIIEELFNVHFVEKTTNLDLNREKHPFKCPVCMGDGKVYVDYVLSQYMVLAGWKIDAEGKGYKTCHSCEGKGIVWG